MYYDGNPIVLEATDIKRVLSLPEASAAPSALHYDLAADEAVLVVALVVDKSKAHVTQIHVTNGVEHRLIPIRETEKEEKTEAASISPAPPALTPESPVPLTLTEQVLVESHEAEKPAPVPTVKQEPAPAPEPETQEITGG